MTRTKTDAGKFYGRDRWTGRLEEVPADTGVPDSVICRRVVDYAPAPVPAAAGVTTCSRCRARIAYNPAGRFQDRPKICMQCAGVQPLPIEVKV